MNKRNIWGLNSENECMIPVHRQITKSASNSTTNQDILIITRENIEQNVLFPIN
jgi:hypothetical protein